MTDLVLTVALAGLAGSLAFAGWCCWDSGYDRGWADRDRALAAARRRAGEEPEMEEET